MENYKTRVAADIKAVWCPNLQALAKRDFDDCCCVLAGEQYDITGNVAGSYTCDRIAARDLVLANGEEGLRLASEYCDSLGIDLVEDNHVDWERIDVLARFAVLSEALMSVIENQYA